MLSSIAAAEQACLWQYTRDGEEEQHRHQREMTTPRSLQLFDPAAEWESLAHERVVKVYLGDLSLCRWLAKTKLQLRIRYADLKAAHTAKVTSSSWPVSTAPTAGVIVFPWRSELRYWGADLDQCKRIKDSLTLSVDLIKVGLTNRTLATAKVQVPVLHPDEEEVVGEKQMVFTLGGEEAACVPVLLEVVDLARRRENKSRIAKEAMMSKAQKEAAVRGCVFVEGKPHTTRTDAVLGVQYDDAVVSSTRAGSPRAPAVDSSPWQTLSQRSPDGLSQGLHSEAVMHMVEL